MKKNEELQSEKKKQEKKKAKKTKKIEKVDTEVEKEENNDNSSEVREVIVEKKVGFNYLEVILIMIIMLILGGFLGNFIARFSDKNNINTDKSQVSDANSSEFKEFIDTYNDIRTNYYEDLDNKELLNAGIKGMIEYLDDKFSNYMDKDETESFNEQVEGKYTGIGVEIIKDGDGLVTIVRIFKDTPAAKSGLKVGDQFLEVAGNEVKDKTTSELATMIKNINDKEFTVKVMRDSKELEFTLSCEEVNIESVSGEILEKNGKKIGYINISVFASNTYSQFLSELSDLEVQGFDSLVIDVRGNTGGYLTTVTNIASIFLEKGKVIYQLDTKGVVEKIKDTTAMKKTYPIAVLIDKGSASASEILASALKESYGAMVVGTASYGKGTVQRAYQLESGATIKYTIQKWLTPKGNWINEVGVEPTTVVELSDDYISNPSNDTDNQLQKALELLSK